MHRIAATSVFVILLCVCANASEHPNVIFMMADDMGMGDTSAFQDFTGNHDEDQIHTPNMERLARMGIRFTDAHTPSTRCSPTRYGLLTGRYPWRNRLKHWVLFGVQGDPMIEADRPTLGTLMQDHGYHTGLVGKWHVGLRYSQSDGKPAAGWDDADLTQPMADTPLDHGFDFCRFTSRSHGTSGIAKNFKQKRNDEHQSIGPGHIHGRTIISATGQGKKLFADGTKAYILNQLGGRHSDHAIGFMSEHLQGRELADQPFFLYYPSNSNHSPYTPDDEIGGVPVARAARSVAGKPMDIRSDYIYENDVALGRMIDFLQQHDDPRNPGHKLIDNTIVVFTSDNGAEIDNDVATGPFRSHKGSAFEGGHRVPFIVAWKAGGVGDGNGDTPGKTSDALIGLHDMFATFTEILGGELPDLRGGQKGGEDSVSVLAAWRGEPLPPHAMFYHDHKQAKDPAIAVLRLDDPQVDGQVVTGKWKVFFDESLLRAGEAVPTELYDLATDSTETQNRIGDKELAPLLTELSNIALLHRTSGGHRSSEIVSSRRHMIDWVSDSSVRKRFEQSDESTIRVKRGDLTVEVSIDSGTNRRSSTAQGNASSGFHVNPRGLGIRGGKVDQVDQGESIVIRCDHDVMIESVAIVAGNGTCGGYYRVADHAPLAIYCVDADIDAKDQSGILSDIGVLKAGETLTLSSSPHLGVETPGQWRLGELTIRELANE
tara:strand:- start:337109 stop:339250 length:2142 start_codon:yes stop_codon:yes gene_type:complete